MKLVIDASVLVKWIFPESPEESDVGAALALLEEVRQGRVEVVQPPHWLLEVAAVVTRMRPEIAETAIDLFDAMELPVAAEPVVLKRASRMAAQLEHHLFDTLYHAVALERGAVLVTADHRYAVKARPLGGIVLLQDWRSSPQPSP
jgi:predicted nucleic acid-binding protein